MEEKKQDQIKKFSKISNVKIADAENHTLQCVDKCNLEHPKVPNKPRLLSQGKTQGLFDFQFETEKENNLDKDKLEIKKEAKELLEKFSRTLGKVKFKEKALKEEFGGMREEGEGLAGDSDFRERFFKNAPHKEGDFILAEKKKW